MESVDQSFGTLWTQCDRSNSSYVDCPIKSFHDKNAAFEPNFNMTVAVHNPSSVDMHTARISVPKACNWNVTKKENGREWEQANAVVHVLPGFDDQSNPIDNGIMEVNVTTLSNEVSMI